MKPMQSLGPGAFKQILAPGVFIVWLPKVNQIRTFKYGEKVDQFEYDENYTIKDFRKYCEKKQKSLLNKSEESIANAS